MGRLVTGRSEGLTRGGRAPALVKGLSQRQGHPDWKGVQLLLRPSLQGIRQHSSFARIKPIGNYLLMNKLLTRGYGHVKLHSIDEYSVTGKAVASECLEAATRHAWQALLSAPSPPSASPAARRSRARAARGRRGWALPCLMRHPCQRRALARSPLHMTVSVMVRTTSTA